MPLRRLAEGGRWTHLGTTVGDTEAGHDLVEHQQGIVLVAQVPAALQELLGGLDEARVADDGLQDDRSDVTALDQLLHVGEVVVRGHQSVLGGALGHA